jgi:hypothetical protein
MAWCLVKYRDDFTFYLLPFIRSDITPTLLESHVKLYRFSESDQSYKKWLRDVTAVT